MPCLQLRLNIRPYLNAICFCPVISKQKLKPQAANALVPNTPRGPVESGSLPGPLSRFPAASAYGSAPLYSLSLHDRLNLVMTGTAETY